MLLLPGQRLHLCTGTAQLRDWLVSAELGGRVQSWGVGMPCQRYCLYFNVKAQTFLNDMIIQPWLESAGQTQARHCRLCEQCLLANKAGALADTSS